MLTTSIYDQNIIALDKGKRIMINQGGTWSSKTWSLNQIQYTIASEDKGCIISIVSESIPHLKRGAMRDFFTMLSMENLYYPKNHNKTDLIYKVGKSIIEFFSVEDLGRVLGARRDYLFGNEIYNISYNTFDQLVVRTRKAIFVDFNPIAEFYIHKEYVNRPDAIFIKSNYLDNPYIEESIKKEIESHKNNENWWRVYGLGEIGSIEGIIYPGYKIISGWPLDKEGNCTVENVSYGLDFGYTDPTAMIKVGIVEKNIYITEMLYEKYLTIADLIKKFEEMKIPKDEEIFADPARPEAIEEIYRAGYNIKPAIKGHDSVITGINILQDCKLFIQKASLNTIKEIRNYTWQTDKEGNFINKPIDFNDHALDALRYAVIMKLHFETAESGLQLGSSKVNRY